MNNLVFYNEDGKLHTELQEYTEIENCDNPKLKCFDKEASYLKIYIRDDISEQDLSKIYFYMLYHNLIEATKTCLEMAKEDFETNNGSTFGTTFEIKCYDFRDAFECGRDLMCYFCEPGNGGWRTEKIEVTLSDEPSESFVKMMERKKKNSASVKNTPINEGV